MRPELIGWMGMAGLIVLIALRVRVAYAMAITGFFGYVAISGFQPALTALGFIPYGRVASYSLTVIPLFIIMGQLAGAGGLVKDVFRTARAWTAWIPGGLVQAAIVGATAFAACCGSGAAATGVLSRVVVPELLRAGVQRRLALGTVAASASIAVMIPPSVPMVVYGVITEQSIGKLLIAGILPGIVTATFYMVMIYIRVKRNPALAPRLENVGWKERFASLRGVWGVGALGLLVIGGIYSGKFTPTEAGGVGAFGALALALAYRRLTWTTFRNGILDTLKTTCMVFLIIACAFIFTNMLAISRLPAQFSQFLTSLHTDRYLFLAAVMILYLILGCFVDMLAVLFLTMPVIYPAILSLGFDPIWFGVIIVHHFEIAQITPPFAFNIFIIKSAFPDIPTGEIYRGIGPFLICELMLLVLFIAFPQIALFLPQHMT